MAKALRDAGFKHVSVEMSVITLEGQKYEVDADLVQWQNDAIDFDFDPEDNDEGNDEGNSNRNGNGNRMTPMTMQLDFERRSVKFLKTMPWTT